MNTKDLAIAVTASHGLTQEEIAAKVGISQTTVSRRLKRPEVKALIEEIQITLIEATAEKTKEIISNLINRYESNACLDKKSEIEKEHGFKCLTKMAETMGIFPAHTQSSVMINILNQQIAPAVTKEIQAIGYTIASLPRIVNISVRYSFAYGQRVRQEGEIRFVGCLTGKWGID